jgi:hypothetical protein
VPAAVATEPSPALSTRTRQLGGPSAKYSTVPLVDSASPATAPSCAVPAVPSNHPEMPLEPAAVVTAPPTYALIRLFPGSLMYRVLLPALKAR